MRDAISEIAFVVSLIFLLAYYTFLGGKAWTLADERVADEIAKIGVRNR